MMRTRNPTRTALCLEALEDRCLLSAGALDTTFGTGGFIATDFGSNIDEVRAISIAGDGKIVAGGITYQGRGNGNLADFGVVRYLPNGALDPSFGVGGKVTTAVGNGSSLLFDVAVQADGKILVAGQGNNDFALVRYNTNGSVDTSFGGKAKGKILTDVNAGSTDRPMAMVLQPDGRIVVVGVTTPRNSSAYDLALVRYKSDGSLDPTFSQDGKVSLPFPMAIAKDSMEVALYPATSASHAGKILVTTATYVLRFNPDGSLDPTFGAGTGYVLFLALHGPSAAIQSDDRILLACSTKVSGQYEIKLTRLEPDGTFDSTFGSEGIGGGIVWTQLPTDEFVHSVAVQTDGKILVAGRQADPTTGSVNYFLVARYNPVDGSLDTTFGINGIATTTAIPLQIWPVDMVLQGDGRIVVAGTTYTSGNFDFAVTRFLGDSALTAASASARLIRQTLSDAEVQPLLVEALARWQNAGANTSEFSGIDIRISDLGGTTLGLASGNTIWLDDNAAGWGWFVEPTPQDDSEFTTPGNQGEEHRMDLLTVLAHEIGHLLGQDHEHDGVMADTLELGMRRMPGGEIDWLTAVDVLFAETPSRKWP